MALPFTRRIAFALLAGVLSLVLSLAAAEGFLRLRYGKIARITGVSEWETVLWQGLTYNWDEYHPRYGWTNRPGYRSDEGLPFQLAINRQGLRGTRDYDPHPGPGTKRIMLFGDSLAFGEDVDDPETVARYLEARIANAEVMNFGVHGFGLGQMTLRLEDEAFALEPDHLLVMLLVPRDLLRDLKSQFVHTKPVFGARDGELTIGNLPVPTAAQQPWLERHSFLAAFLFARASTGDSSEEEGLHIEVGQLLLERLRARAAAEGVPLSIVFVGSAVDLERLQREPDERARLDATREALRRPGLDVLDLIPFLERRVLAEGRALATESWHWSARGNCLIAGEIANHLMRLHASWSPPRGGQRCPPLPRGF